MLYMVVNTHTAESCAFRGEDEARHLEPAFDGFLEEAGNRAIAIKGSWINRAAHEAFILVESPDAHTIDDLIVSTGLVGRTSTRVLSVIALDDAVTPYSDAIVSERATA